MNNQAQYTEYHVKVVVKEVHILLQVLSLEAPVAKVTN